VATGQQRALTAGPLNGRDPAVSPDATHVAVSIQTLREAIHEFSLETGPEPAE
jgi:hypothetical protein